MLLRLTMEAKFAKVKFKLWDEINGNQSIHSIIIRQCYRKCLKRSTPYGCLTMNTLNWCNKFYFKFALKCFKDLIRHIFFLILALLNQDRHCFWKQCRSRSDGFWRSHLIRTYTFCHSVSESIWTNNTELSVWLTVRNGCGKPNLFSRISPVNKQGIDMWLFLTKLVYNMQPVKIQTSNCAI